ncbi:UNKNOWN [Stylonychia lemnae]|uniref:Tldc domain-containing protein n=1 Tax=Stylonychia lemnae TaxID=5949 RepID=A0A077ZSP6_STYLE|nr:UNKNOWN [Stylonychia lemnae]|eukprot:CDW72897.1 UNKNOWN [Stylonychia lemnae]
MNIYVCKGCDRPYNLQKRKPMNLSCGYTICNHCIEQQTSNEGILKTCPSGDSCQLKDHSLIVPAKNLIQNLDQLNIISIICDKHPQKMIKTYCKTTHQFLCNDCSNSSTCNNHCKIEHQNVNRKDMEDFIQLKTPILQNHIERIQELLQSLTEYQNNDKMFKSTELLNLISQINEYQNKIKSKKDLSFLFDIRHQVDQSIQKDNEEHNNLSFQDIKQLQICKPKQQTEQEDELLQIITERDKPKYFRRLVDFHLNILKNQQVKSFQNNLLPLRGKCKLLYKATGDQFTASSFHQKCDNQGPTISFIQSEHGQVFGGYTSLSWTSPDRVKSQKDNDAFVFSLSKNSLHKQHQNLDRAVSHHKDQLMVFGGGISNDIAIQNDCNNNSNSLCSLGGTYQTPFGFNKEEQFVKDYLGGSYNFKVMEIEVYSVQQ